MSAEKKFYVWSNSLQLVVAARSPWQAAQKLVQYGFDCDRLVELAESINCSETGFSEATSRFLSGPVLGSIDLV